MEMKTPASEAVRTHESDLVNRTPKLTDLGSATDINPVKEVFLSAAEQERRLALNTKETTQSPHQDFNSVWILKTPLWLPDSDHFRTPSANFPNCRRSKSFLSYHGRLKNKFNLLQPGRSSNYFLPPKLPQPAVSISGLVHWTPHVVPDP